MIRLLGLLLLFALPAWVTAAAERTIQTVDIQGVPPLEPDDPVWNRAPAANVMLYPQATAPGGPGGGPVSLEARLLLGGGKLAVRLAWADASEEIADARATHRFADAVAVQFAAAGKTLPYVGMGEPAAPVQLWFWRAGRPAERLAAQGFGSLAVQPGAPPEVQAKRTAKGWMVVLRGRVEEKAPAAIAFAAWDGAEDGRAGRKRLSAWQALATPGGTLPAALREEARFHGNPAQGERLYAAHGCAACHAPSAGLGPSLAHAGGIHWPGYLRRSITEPSVFIVPGAAHSASAGVSLMPKKNWTPEALEDLVAYLMSLQ